MHIERSVIHERYGGHTKMAQLKQKLSTSLEIHGKKTERMATINRLAISELKIPKADQYKRSRANRLPKLFKSFDGTSQKKAVQQYTSSQNKSKKCK